MRGIVLDRQKIISNLFQCTKDIVRRLLVFRNDTPTFSDSVFTAEELDITVFRGRENVHEE